MRYLAAKFEISNNAKFIYLSIILRFVLRSVGEKIWGGGGIEGRILGPRGAGTIPLSITNRNSLSKRNLIIFNLQFSEKMQQQSKDMKSIADIILFYAIAVFRFEILLNPVKLLPKNHAVFPECLQNITLRSI